MRRYGGFYGPTCVVDFALIPGSTSNIIKIKLKPNGTIAFISFSGFTPKDVGKTMYLSNNGNLKEAAVNLFSILHNLEEDQQTDYIIAEQVPGQGIAKAIMDKLHKASYRYKNPESNEKD